MKNLNISWETIAILFGTMLAAILVGAYVQQRMAEKRIKELSKITTINGGTTTAGGATTVEVPTTDESGNKTTQKLKLAL